VSWPCWSARGWTTSCSASAGKRMILRPTNAPDAPAQRVSGHSGRPWWAFWRWGEVVPTCRAA
jgi:hypothetical protein